MRIARTFKAALSGAVRRGTMDGVEYVVAPVVALVEGVIHASNSPAPELVLAAEFGKVPQGWDGRPLMFDHPHVDGAVVSANSPEVLEAWRLGWVFGAALEENKLTMEAWFDPRRAERIEGAMELLEKVQSGETTEVSVGVFVTSQPADGIKDGMRYAAVWKDIVPDHLAALPVGTIGACSIEMGCGTPRAAEGDMKIRAAGTVPKNPPGDKMASRDTAWSAPTLSDFTAESWDALSDSEKRRIATHFAWAAELPPASYGDLKLPHHRASDGAAVFRGVSAALGRLDQTDIPSADKDKVRAHLEAHQRDFDKQKNAGGFMKIKERFAALMAKLRLSQDGEELSDYDVRAALETALFAEEPGFLGVVEVYPDSSSVIYATAPEGEVKFYRRGYEQDPEEQDKIKFTGAPEEVRQVTRYEPVTAAAGSTCGCGGPTKASAGKEDNAMKTKKERVAAVIASGKTPFTTASAAALEALPEEELKKLEEAVEAPPEPAPAAPPAPPAGDPPADPPAEETPEQKDAAFYERNPDIKEIVETHRAAARTKKTNLVAKLEAAQKAYSKTELEAMSVPALEKLASAVIKEPVDYRGAGGPRVEGDSDNQVPEPIDMTARIKAARDKKSA